MLCQESLRGFVLATVAVVSVQLLSANHGYSLGIRHSNKIRHSRSGDVSRELQCGGDKWVCRNGGECVKNRCLCPIGFTGETCSQSLTAVIPHFSGKSYLEYGTPARLLRKKFTIYLHFIAEESSGLLFYAGGRFGDHIAISLVNNIVIYRYNCGSGTAEIRSNTAVGINKQTKMLFGREGRNGYLSVNEEAVIEGKSKGESSDLNLRGNMFVGGYKDLPTVKWTTQVSSGFVGCIHYLELNTRKIDLHYKSGLNNVISGFDIGDCAAGVCPASACGSGECVPNSMSTRECHCPLGKSGLACFRDENIDEANYIPQFSGNSYLLFNSLPESIQSSMQLTLVVKLVGSNGLLFYTGADTRNNHHINNGDFLSVQLENGKIVVGAELGSGHAVLRSKGRLTREKWTKIEIYRHGREIRLLVDGQDPVSGITPGYYAKLNTNGNIYIGGHIDLDETLPRADASSLFHGCILKVVVNDVQLLTRDAVNGRNVVACSHICLQRGICGSDGGRCVADGDGHYCACPLHKTGARCGDDVGPVSIPYFKGSGFLLLNDEGTIAGINSDLWDIRVRMRADCRDCVILWIGQARSTSSGDYLFLGIDDQGYPHASFDLGAGPVNVSYNQILDYQQWYSLRIHRNKYYAFLKVGEENIMDFSGQSHNYLNYTKLNTNSGLYLGGYPPGLRFKNFKFFEGCIELLKINGQEINPMEQAVGGENIEQCNYI